MNLTFGDLTSRVVHNPIRLEEHEQDTLWTLYARTGTRTHGESGPPPPVVTEIEIDSARVHLVPQDGCTKITIANRFGPRVENQQHPSLEELGSLPGYAGGSPDLGELLLKLLLVVPERITRGRMTCVEIGGQAIVTVALNPGFTGQWMIEEFDEQIKELVSGQQSPG